MKLATRCPSCGAAFRVRPDQLQASEGWVRCGACQTAFQALEGLFDPEHEEPPPKPPGGAPPAPPRAVAPGPGPAAGPPGLAAGPAWDDAAGLRLAGRAAEAAGLRPPARSGWGARLRQGLLAAGVLALATALAVQGLRLQGGPAWQALADAWPELEAALARMHQALAPGPASLEAPGPGAASGPLAAAEAQALKPWRLLAGQMKASADGHGQVLTLEFQLDGERPEPPPRLELELLGPDGGVLQRQRLEPGPDPAASAPATPLAPGSRLTLPVHIEPGRDAAGAVQVPGWRLRAARP